MTDKENKTLNKLIAAAGFLTRAYNKFQTYEDEKMIKAMKEANAAIDGAIEILNETPTKKI